MKRLPACIYFLLLSLALQAHAVEATPSEYDKHVIAACLILEAANQGEKGMQAVASVIANRAQNQSTRYLSVVLHPYAFSALNTATTPRKNTAKLSQLVRRASQDIAWKTAVEIVEKLYAGSLEDLTFGANHYSRRDELPSWSHGMRATTVIGDHLFFKSL